VSDLTHEVNVTEDAKFARVEQLLNDLRKDLEASKSETGQRLTCLGKLDVGDFAA